MKDSEDKSLGSTGILFGKKYFHSEIILFELNLFKALTFLFKLGKYSHP